eukprot:scaffold49633_cov32-Prasinocladus_malaysianus.AAC.1
MPPMSVLPGMLSLSPDMCLEKASIRKAMAAGASSCREQPHELNVHHLTRSNASNGRRCNTTD